MIQKILVLFAVLLIALPLQVHAGAQSTASAAATGSNTVQKTGSETIHGTKILDDANAGTVAAGQASPTSLAPLTSADSRTPNMQTLNMQTLRQAIAHVCVEDYLWADRVNGGTDYGAALNAAVRAASLTAVTEIDGCVPGDHPVYTPEVIDRPIALKLTSVRQIPKATGASGATAFGQSPITLTGAVLTTGCNPSPTPGPNFGLISGCTTVTVPSTNMLSPGMRIGGVGTGPSNYIASIIDGTHLVLQMPAFHTFTGICTSGSASITKVQNLAGLAVGMHLTWQGQTSGVAISALNYSDNTITLTSNASSCGSNPTIYTTTGTITETLTALAATPVIRWVHNTSALSPNEGQNIGGSMTDVMIADPTKGGVTSAQGVEIAGWDFFKIHNLKIDNLDGAGLIIGGMGMWSSGGVNDNASTRQSSFYGVNTWGCGDYATRQGCVEVMTPPESNNPTVDEINQILFSGINVNYNFGNGLVIGTYNRSHAVYAGPRLLWFNGNSQFEGGSDKIALAASPVDVVYLYNAHLIWFSDGEIATPGFGYVVLNCYFCQQINLTNNYISPVGKKVVYQVSATAGTPNLQLASCTSGFFSCAFDQSGMWDGVGVTLVDGASCTTASPCYAHLAPSGSVTSSRALKLAANTPTATCSTGSPCTMTIGFGGSNGWTQSATPWGNGNFGWTTSGNFYDSAGYLDSTAGGIHTGNAAGTFFGNTAITPFSGYFWAAPLSMMDLPRGGILYSQGSNRVDYQMPWTNVMPPTTLNGTTAGQVYWSEVRQDSGMKTVNLNFQGYQNSGATAQTINLSGNSLLQTFSYAPSTSGSCPAGLRVSTSIITLPASMGSGFTGQCQVNGQ
jgi:hypothetical protein